jgi:hypothetical protein
MKYVTLLRENLSYHFYEWLIFYKIFVKKKCFIKFINHYQSLVDQVVIGVELGMNDYSSIPATMIGKKLKSLDVKTDSWTRLSGPVCRILVVKKILVIWAYSID